MYVEQTFHQGYYCWMFASSPGTARTRHQREISAIKQMCRERLGRSHGSLVISSWVSAHSPKLGRNGWPNRVLFVRDHDVATQAILTFC